MQTYTHTEIRDAGTADERKVYLTDKNQLHRTDGPAVEWSDGYKSWYINGKRHRTDGPAIERLNGSKEWYYWFYKKKYSTLSKTFFLYIFFSKGS